MTQHATIRMQQRGIKEETLDILFKFGSKMHDRHGCVILYFDKQSRKRINKFTNDAIQFKSFESQLSTYAVVSVNGEVLTVGHRIKKINRH